MQQRFSLEPRLQQKLALTPALMQSLKVLQLSNLELADYLAHEISENPFLEETASRGVRIDENRLIKNDEQQHKMEYLEESSDPGAYLNYRKNDENGKTSVIEKTASRPPSLSEHLLGQLSLLYPEDSAEYSAGELIIGSLDTDGFFTAQAREAVNNEINNPARLDNVLEQIKKFHPPGIASENIQECLIRQLEEAGGASSFGLLELVKNSFDDLRRKKIRELAVRYDVPEEAVINAAQIISHLEPKPARNFTGSDNREIIPEIIVRANAQGEFDIIIDNEIIPRIVFNDTYRRFKKLESNEEFSKFIREKEGRAHNLMSSIRYRRQNLKKIASALLEKQIDFFRNGPKALKPQTLTAMADKLGLNEGTLSRLANSKYIQTSWGVFPLRYFFTSSVTGEQGAVSSRNVKELIREIISEYDEGKKLSDRKIVEILNKKGISVARRTVAKYRNNINILSSFNR